MKKIIIVFCIIALLAIVTNPGEESHRATLKTEVRQKINHLAHQVVNTDKTWQEIALGTVVTVSVTNIDQKIDEAVSTEDYLFFSLTNIRIKNQCQGIGIGAFGNVWLDDDVVQLIDFREL